MDEHQELADELHTVLAAAHTRMMRVEPQLRRFARAMADLGAPVPAEWAHHDGDQVTFGDLTAKQFDRLICLVEDLAARRTVTVTVMRGGPSLFDPGAPAGPVPAPVASTVHMVVPQ